VYKLTGAQGTPDGIDLMLVVGGFNSSNTSHLQVGGGMGGGMGGRVGGRGLLTNRAAGGWQHHVCLWGASMSWSPGLALRRDRDVG
jgi:hypothetical protein